MHHASLRKRIRCSQLGTRLERDQRRKLQQEQGAVRVQPAPPKLFPLAEDEVAHHRTAVHCLWSACLDQERQQALLLALLPAKLPCGGAATGAA